ncbi:MAG TPA: hypothetical protein VEZ13_16280 [Brevibacillus sp.]|nr:hypothetical protein [Brevibacillus sp.]
MKREDALFNWLQIQVVADARPDDKSALDTAAFFRDVLREDHGIEDLAYRREGDWYVLTDKTKTEASESRYPAEAIDALLVAIENEPRYQA